MRIHSCMPQSWALARTPRVCTNSAAPSSQLDALLRPPVKLHKPPRGQPLHAGALDLELVAARRGQEPARAGGLPRIGPRPHVQRLVGRQPADGFVVVPPRAAAEAVDVHLSAHVQQQQQSSETLRAEVLPLVEVGALGVGQEVGVHQQGVRLGVLLQLLHAAAPLGQQHLVAFAPAHVGVVDKAVRGAAADVRLVTPRGRPVYAHHHVSCVDALPKGASRQRAVAPHKRAAVPRRGAVERILRRQQRQQPLERGARNLSESLPRG
mmetsp:Transcript_22312/g.58144  ORF Transcript_22312/g.58144 Transcript_22312/m.58144 type:complete len:266 (+) Transcript_22312:1109-1906(+)